ncbi:hypothetical protein V8F20_009123 [Naviculisporaceae sp. PSN 640]
MTEPENFDDDMFADLYDDNDTAPKAEASEPTGNQFSAVQSAAAEDVKNESNSYDAAEDTKQYQQYNNGDEQHMNNGDVDEDDDDEVDFNLGNGPATTSASAYQDDVKSEYNAPAPSQAQSRGPNAKEDGTLEGHDGSVRRVLGVGQEARELSKEPGNRIVGMNSLTSRP